jgi:hypothetical protein
MKEYKKKITEYFFNLGVSQIDQEANQREIDGTVWYNVGSTANILPVTPSEEVHPVSIETMNEHDSELPEKTMFKMKKPSGYAVTFFKQFTTLGNRNTVGNHKKVNS